MTRIVGSTVGKDSVCIRDELSGRESRITVAGAEQLSNRVLLLIDLSEGVDIGFRDTKSGNLLGVYVGRIYEQDGRLRVVLSFDAPREVRIDRKERNA